MGGWFHYAKLYAAAFGCIGFMFLKYKQWIGKTDWFKVWPFVIVAINIMIAVASDFESAIKGAQAVNGWWYSIEDVWLNGGWWNWVNGIAGILNIFCMTGGSSPPRRSSRKSRCARGIPNTPRRIGSPTHARL